MRLAALAALRASDGDAALVRELRRLPLFVDLPRADALAVFDALSEQEVGAGTVLCRRGEPGDRAFITQAGTVEVRLGLAPDGVHLRRLGPGDVFGEMSLVTGRPRSADIVAVDAAVLWVLDRADFLALTARSVALLQTLTRTLAGRMAENAEQVDRRPAGPAPGRPADGPGGAPDGGRPSPLSPREREVAALVARGLTNREIAAGLVVTERTAATHIEHILSKLDLRSRAQVAAWAVEQGMLSAPPGPGAPGAPGRQSAPGGPGGPGRSAAR
jgi:CRP-like cAMP-binding protein